MRDLVVIPEYLKKLATIQDQAADKQGAAAKAASNLSGAVWVSHGVASAPSNMSLTTAEAARRAAGEAMKKASADLAVKLRTAGTSYESVDTQLGHDLDKQLLDR
jgi:hypothetical protein